MTNRPKSSLESAFAWNSTPRPPPKEGWKLDAAVLEQAGLGDKYLIDEERLHIFEGLHYCGQWMARFRPTFQEYENPNNPYTKVHDLPYFKVLRGAQVMANNWIKPSQSYRALREFALILDHEVAKLDFSHDP